jgi:prepilin-type N-terminal cleavage/methylation domain-containing protein
MTRKAFTLIELVVALAILAVILSFAGVIFRVSVDSQRIAMANAEIMQKFRVIADQLDADFKGGATRYPYNYKVRLSYRTQPRTVAGTLVPANSDAIQLFTAGDFRSTQQYGGDTIAGNVASVLYCQPDPNSYRRPPQPYEQVLLRRQTITAVRGPAAGSDPRGEYYGRSPEEWVVKPLPPFVNVREWMKRPIVEPNNVKASLPMYVAQGVDGFTVEYWDGVVIDNSNPANPRLRLRWARPAALSSSDIEVDKKAYKFTFTLYDSKGIIRKGRTFTHIVVWDN